MKEIPLTQGKVALVDDDDYDYLMQWKWFAANMKGVFYAGRHVYDYEKHKAECRITFMHRVIMETPVGLVVDHVDHNTLNNQRSNLRNCTEKENRRNTKKRPTHFKGVHECKDGRKKKYRASLNIGGKTLNLHYHYTPEEAAREYDENAIRLFGKFALINFPEEHVKK